MKIIKDKMNNKEMLLFPSLHPFIPSSLHPFIPSSLHPFIPSSLHPFIPSSLHPFIPDSNSLRYFKFQMIQQYLMNRLTKILYNKVF